MRAPNTNSTHTMTHASMAEIQNCYIVINGKCMLFFTLSITPVVIILKLPVRPSALGMFVVMVLKMLTKTRKTVTKSVILPGTISGGTKKLIQDTITNMPEGR